MAAMHTYIAAVEYFTKRGAEIYQSHLAQGIR